jgi:TonB family protein
MKEPGEVLWVVLADAALKGSVVLIAAFGLSLVLRRASAAARHLAWTLAAVCLMALPFASLVAPSWEVPVERVFPRAAGLIYHLEAWAPGLAGGTLVSGAVGSAAAAAPTAPGSPSPAGVDWRIWGVTAWSFGVLFLLLLYGAGTARVWILSRRGRPAPDSPWGELACELAGKLAIRRPVRVRLAVPGTMPMTWGLIRPEVLLPEDASEWPEERRRVVLLHELAHIKRRDCLTQAMARAACILYWFHPLAWAVGRRLLKERERASDDLVLKTGAKASDYAGHLLEVARSLRAPAMGWAGLAMSRPPELEGRLLAILNSGARRGMPGRAGVTCAAAVSLCFLLALGAVRPATAVSQEPAAALDEQQAGQLARQYSERGDYARMETLAEALAAQSRCEEARKISEAALPIRHQALGSDSTGYATGLLRAAGLVRACGALEEAESLAQRALEIQERALGSSDPALFETLSHLAIAAHARKDFAYAERLYLRAAALRAPGDTEAGDTLARLGMLYDAQNRPGEAETSFQRAITIHDRAGQTGRLATALELYTRFLKAQSRTAEAEAVGARARQIRLGYLRDKYGPAAARAGGPVLRMSPGMSPPRPLQKVEPQYSEDARIAKYQGLVVLSIEVGTDGRTHAIQVREPAGLGLDEKAVEAVRNWRFAPATRDGQPVSVAATVEVNFRLL